MTSLDLLLVCVILGTLLAVILVLRAWKDDLGENLDSLRVSLAEEYLRADYLSTGPWWLVAGLEFRGPYHDEDTARGAFEHYADVHPTQAVHLLTSVDLISPRAAEDNAAGDLEYSPAN